jgi:putative MATE family efflux protein
MVVSAVSLGCNTLLNYLLVYGKLGFPSMGVNGSALATLIARIVEIVLLVTIIYKKKYALAGRLAELFNLSKEYIIKFFRTTTPVILNEGFWSLGMTMYSAAYARISTGAVAAVQISNTIQNLFMVIFFGMGNACAVMIGNKIGADEKTAAISYAKKYSVMGPALGLVMGTALVAAAPKVMLLFNVSEVVQKDIFRILVVLAIFMSIKIFNIILVVGILRSGGDTKFSMFLEMGSVWLVGVPLAFLGSIVWKLPIYSVIALVSIEEVVKASFGIPRLLSNKWVRNVVEHM